MQLYKSIENIYNLLEDDESRKIFLKRLEYSITKDRRYLDEMIKELMESYSTTDPVIKLIAWIKSHNNQKLIIFGAGFAGREIIEALNLYGISPECICDNNQGIQGLMLYELPVVSVDYLINKHKDDCIIIASNLYSKEIYEQLTEQGFSADNIFYQEQEWWIGGKKQYFDRNIILPGNCESFLDGGAYHGETTADFIEWCHGNYDAVYAFEPDERNSKVARQYFEHQGFHNCNLYHAGLYNERTKLNFAEGNTAASTISEMGTSTIQTETIDNILNGKPITFIKMDIEGAELAALQGAEKTIRKYAPRLAICIYHKPEDIIEIPEYIHELHPEYKFYIRHYSYIFTETVLYAV